MANHPPEDEKSMSVGAIVGLILLALVILGGGICVYIFTGG